ncbi:hypothetical protein BCR39DRAFT_71252 [Naematelia encephala]|uniref:Uncharacterized protein n=1 Tax=Naematelia encephala TaxID=71784 RepID=A0A1Y2BBX1_9TREE|nr:hypothetical protein BCR39DRAFT_71252 [Naematelia encephala]
MKSTPAIPVPLVAISFRNRFDSSTNLGTRVRSPFQAIPTWNISDSVLAPFVACLLFDTSSYALIPRASMFLFYESRHCQGSLCHTGRWAQKWRLSAFKKSDQGAAEEWDSRIKQRRHTSLTSLLRSPSSLPSPFLPLRPSPPSLLLQSLDRQVPCTAVSFISRLFRMPLNQFG